MTAATTGGYAAWVTWLDAFGRGENPSTDRLAPVDGHLGSFVEARLLDRLSTAFGARVRHWQSGLAHAVVATPPRDHVAAAAMLREAGADLEPLARLAGSSLLPRTVGVAMHEALAQVREGARAALEEAWRRERSDGAPAVTPAPRVDALPAAAGRRLPVGSDGVVWRARPATSATSATSAPTPVRGPGVASVPGPRGAPGRPAPRVPAAGTRGTNGAVENVVLPPSEVVPGGAAAGGGGDRGGRGSRSPQQSPPTARVGGDAGPGAVATPGRGRA